MNADTSTDPPFRRHADPRCRSCGQLEIDVAHAPVEPAVAHTHHHPVSDELRHLREIEEEGQSPATSVIMAGSVWIVAAVIVVFVTAAVYLAVRLGL